MSATTNPDWESGVRDAVQSSGNLGEMQDADTVGTVGSPDCGDMLRMWIKFREENGRRVIDRATFQTFGCETALAVASVATRLIEGKTPEEALAMDGPALSAPLGPLPPMKIHCAQMVESALRSALAPQTPPTNPAADTPAPRHGSTLLESFLSPAPKKITLLDSQNP